MKDLDALTGQWRASGHRLTPQRLAIFRELCGNRVHPTAEDIYRKLSPLYPSLSRNTVYATLNELSKMGEVKEIFLERKVSHFDPNSVPHAHTRCRKCGTIQDVAIASTPGLTAQLRKLGGFRVEKFQILLHGLCKNCRKNQNPQTPKRRDA